MCSDTAANASFSASLPGLAILARRGAAAPDAAARMCIRSCRETFWHNSRVWGVLGVVMIEPPSGQAEPTAVGDVGELFRDRREPMARLAYVLTSDAAVSDEIVQEAFLKVHTNWAQITNPSAYLRAAVVNGCRSHHRHIIVERSIPADRTRAEFAVTDEISDALAKVSYPRRAVLALRYFCDLPDSEIAELLHIRPATVRSRIARGLKDLRKELEQ